ncbi:uncharacterized protein C10orf67, mitochondrial-like isoform X2 [Actinia tenebrosa]|uniref:Uncharacterized protein C10orf67, mitochondrial-like isoform X2 n=1 Tax=Actinia tenebrosa TaxID=6105 RepID=A0A6P8I0M5_ACTTE|nr:uncharacterized protein C10orf67, mitochondrial-like isoform X2 [Actinia tenebrosa]
MAEMEISRSPNEDGSNVGSSRSLPSAENPTIRSLKSADIRTLVSPPSGGSSATGRSLSPDTRSSPAALEFEEYRPSIADKVRIGFFSQDRCSQTESSEILPMKEMQEVMAKLVTELDNIKRNLHYSKHIMQAEYENKLQERALDLYCRVNDRILDLEKIHEGKLDVIRRSYKQRLGDAISEVANKHKDHYNKKRAEEQDKIQAKLEKAQGDDDDKKKAQQQQESLLEMMRMQMKEAKERADAQIKEALERRPSPSSVDTDPEIYELRDEVLNLETKLDEALTEIDEKDNTNRRLALEVEDLTEQLKDERKTINQLKNDLSNIQLKAEQERNRLRAEMERQKIALQNEMESRIQETKKSVLAQSQKEVEKLRKLHDQKSKEQELLEKRLQESMKTERPAVSYKSYKPAVKSLWEKEEVSESEKDGLIARLQKIERKQRTEISRLQKELDRANKMWEMKVTILQQTMHALRDESFLRTSLQRQAAKLQHAAVVYASSGPAVIPLQDPHRPAKTFRTLPAIRPGRVEGFGRILEGKRIMRDIETPFTEERPTPVPEDLESDDMHQNSENEYSESISFTERPPKDDTQSCHERQGSASHVVPAPMATEA